MENKLNIPEMGMDYNGLETNPMEGMVLVCTEYFRGVCLMYEFLTLEEGKIKIREIVNGEKDAL